MGVTSYDFSNPTGVSSVSGTVEEHNNPTFSNDGQQIEENISHMGEFNPVVELNQTKTRVIERTTGIPSSRGDKLKLAFLIGFPLFFMIVGIVVTGTHV